VRATTSEPGRAPAFVPHAAGALALAALAALAACVPAAPASPGSEPAALPPSSAAAPARWAAEPAAPTPIAPEACEIAPGALVEVRAVDPTLRVDVRYATDDNFTGARLPGYEAPLAMLRPSAAEALARVQRRLAGEGLGLKVYDGYRPMRATRAMVAWAERTGNGWVLTQGYVARRSGHNRGNTVDLTLVRLEDGAELDMGTPFDTFSPAAHTANASGEVRRNRQTLVRAMAAEGFVNYRKEWWHFSREGPYGALDVPLGCFR
jgi:zinc D-Ala-D-Ala dipeptidase